jgi:hypothetical protein
MSFELDLRHFQRKSNLRTATVVRKIALDVLVRVVKRTPVDTGRARANWQTTVGQMADGEVDSTDPTGGESIGKGATEIESWDPSKAAVFLTNNVPYIGYLESGSSQQAPAGMVAVTLSEYPGIVDKNVGAG